MSRSSLYVVVYDVSEDAERNQVDRVLAGYGFRVQKSVYEIRVSKYIRKNLIRELEKLEIKSGGILLYRADGNERYAAVGINQPAPDHEVAFII